MRAPGSATSRSGLRATAGYETAVCLLVALVVECGLRTMTLPTLARMLGVRLSDRPLPHEPPPLLPRWTQRWLVATERVTSRWPVGPEGTCLRTALVAGNRLRSLHPQLVLGVRRSPDGVAAHAWLVVAGGSLDPSAHQFRQLHTGTA